MAKPILRVIGNDNAPPVYAVPKFSSVAVLAEDISNELLRDLRVRIEVLQCVNGISERDILLANAEAFSTLLIASLGPLNSRDRGAVIERFDLATLTLSY